MIATILKNLNWEYFEKEEIASIPTSILKVCVILLKEKENIDEDEMPFHHLPPSYFHELAEKYHDKHPDLNLPELAKKYEEMYEHWPDKPKQE
ncbi:MAG: hypothetical protein R2791_15625 [Saprospiraceae bacterium]